MAEHKSHAETTSASALSFPQKHYFLIRRLHSLSGLVPLGVFLVIHLATNSTILLAKDGAEFQKAVQRIHDLGPALLPVEIVGIFIPLLFHALVGIAIAFTGKSNMESYRYGGNVRYTLQRVTAYIALVFIGYHLYQMHWLGSPFPGGGNFELYSNGAASGAATAAAVIQSGWWVAPLYAVGIVATVFHLANGIWTALITWGITIRPRTQQVSGYICAAFGVVVTVMGLGALVGFRNFDAAKAGQVAVRMNNEQ